MMSRNCMNTSYRKRDGAAKVVPGWGILFDLEREVLEAADRGDPCHDGANSFSLRQFLDCPRASHPMCALLAALGVVGRACLGLRIFGAGGLGVELIGRDGFIGEDRQSVPFH